MEHATTELTQTTQPTQNQSTEIPSFVQFNDYTNLKLSCTPAEQKTIPGTGPNAKPPSPPSYYYQIPLMYNFGTDAHKVLNDFLLEGPEFETGSGITSKPGQSGRLDNSIMIKFDLNNPDHIRFVEINGQIHAGCAWILQQMKGQVKLPHFKAEDPEATGLKNPIYYPRDELSGEIIQGRAPSMFFKLFTRGKAPQIDQTLFTDVNGKPIPWSLLSGVEMKFIPLLHIKRLYIGGGKASIQMEMVSAIVTSIRSRNSTTRQLATIQRLHAERPELSDMVSAQLAKLSSERQEALLGPSVMSMSDHSDPNDSGNQPTFAGILGPSASSPSSIPSIPGAAITSIQDFTAGAPPRIPTTMQLN